MPGCPPSSPALTMCGSAALRALATSPSLSLETRLIWNRPLGTGVIWRAVPGDDAHLKSVPFELTAEAKDAAKAFQQA